MSKVLRDGVLVDVDENGNLVSEVKPSSVGPLEGTNNSGVSADKVLTEAHDALVNTPGRTPESRKELRDQLREEFKDETEEQIDARLLRKIETEGRAAADRDSEEARGLSHLGPNEPLNADKAVTREDGTVTTRDKPELTAVYLHGTRVLITDEQRAKYDELLAEMNALMGDTAPGDIPLGDPYYTKRAELEAFVARLKR